MRKVIRDNNAEEMWIDIAKLNETAYQLVNVTLNQSLATQWAMYISIIISVLMAAFLIIGFVYGVNVIQQ